MTLYKKEHKNDNQNRPLSEDIRRIKIKEDKLITKEVDK